jgi:hypothetical protein
MNGEKTFKEGEIPNDLKKEYHKFDRIATKMYGAAGSNAVDAGMAVYPSNGSRGLRYYWCGKACTQSVPP